MLILLDPEFLDAQLHTRLLSFLRHPFSDESCQWVDGSLPDISALYRAMASSKSGWRSASDYALANDAMEILRPVRSVQGRKLPVMPAELSKAQVVMLQEELRDREEWAHRCSSSVSLEGRGSRKRAVHALRGEAVHEAVFMVLAGLFEVRRDGQLIEFSLTNIGKDCMRSRSLGFTLEAQSNHALRWTLSSLIEQLRARRHTPSDTLLASLEPPELDLLTSRLLDSQFSISSFMQTDPKTMSLIGAAKSLCRWFVVLEITRLAGEQAYYPHEDELIRFDLDLDLLKRVLRVQASTLYSDQGIYVLPDGGITLAQTSLEHAITCCKHTVLDVAACTAIGPLFESFVYSYIENGVSPDDYVVRRGIETGANDKGGAYDCDLIIYEPARRKVFFIQVKWKRDARTANLDDELGNWRDRNWPMTKGVRQLAKLRERLGETKVMDQVRTESPRKFRRPFGVSQAT